MINISYNELQAKYSEDNLKIPKLLKKMKNLDKDENAKFNVENIFPEIVPENFDKTKNLILIGEVQSGKTNNIVELVKKVLLEGTYDHVLWLSGTNKNLATQTFQRYVAENKENLYSGQLFFYDSNEFSGNEDFLINNLSRPEQKVIALVLKQSFHLKKFINCLQKSLIVDKKLLIVDDECDFFSLTIGKEGPQKNSIKKNLEELLYNFDYFKTLYMGVTATPFSNFNVKKSGNLFPNKAILLNSNKDHYTGLNWFNQNKDKIYILTSDKKDTEKINDSLSLGLVNFIYSYSIRKSENFTEMLINVDLENIKHEKVFGDVKNLFKNWKQNLIFNRSQLFAEIKEISKRLNYDLDDKKIDELLEIINNWEELFSIYILNSAEETEYRKRKYDSNRENCIVIGGVLVSRGFTFENLTTEIMINGPQSKNGIDILLQRARWFGYRLDSKNLMRVIMNYDIYNAFLEAEIIQNVMQNHFKDKWVIDDIQKLYNILKAWENGFKSLKVG